MQQHHNSSQQQLQYSNDYICKIISKKSKNLSPKVQEFVKQFFTCQKNSLSSYLEYPSKNGQRSVCAKQFRKGDIIVECYDCRVDSSCVICMECFQYGNHQNHKYVIKKSDGGCCDCGDRQAWKKDGFCTKHSGQLLDVQIDIQTQIQFLQSFQQLFEIYFQTYNQNKSIELVLQIGRYLLKLNKNSIYYNKLTTKLLIIEIFQDIQPKNILGNILKFRNQPISNLFNQLYIAMFPYYPFKIQLLKSYFKYYHLIYDGSQKSYRAGSSISCQLLTSYQVVEKCLKDQTLIPIGQKLNLKNRKRTIRLSLTVLDNLQSLCNLKEDIATQYFRYHIRYGINSLFLFYAKILKQVQNFNLSGIQNGQLFKMNTLIQFCGVQFEVHKTLSSIIRVIKNDTQILGIFIKQLFIKLGEQQLKPTVPIFRPYQRALSILLFAYFQMNLNDSKQNLNKLLKLLQITQQQLQRKCLPIFQRIVTTFFYTCQIICFSGMHNTLENYLYFYKQNSKLMFNLDIILIKQLIFVCNVSTQVIFNLLNKKVKENIKVYILFLKNLNYIYISKNSEIYVAHALTNGNCQIYQKEVQKLFKNIVIKYKNNIFKNQIKEITDNYFYQKFNIIDNCLKKFCEFDCIRKCFYVNKQIQSKISNPMIQLDYTVNKFQFINDYNIQILNRIWKQQSLNKIIQDFEQIKINFPQNPLQKQLMFQYYIIYNLTRNFIISSSQLIQKYIINTPLAVKYKYFLEQSNLNTLQNQQNQRKQKLKQIKQAKIKQIKLKQQKALKIINNNEQQQSKQSKQQERQLFCCICKSKQKKQLVYLVNLAISNYQKFINCFQNKDGIQCFSFKSCYHVFDYQCIQMALKIKKCPVCRMKINCFFPYQLQQVSLGVLAFQHIEQFVIKQNVQKIDLLQQLLKSFYHFVILSILDISYCLQKKAKIYKQLYHIIKKVVSKNKLKKVLKQFNDQKYKTQILNVSNNMKREISILTIRSRIVRLLTNQQQQQHQLNQINQQFQQIQKLMGQQNYSFSSINKKKNLKKIKKSQYQQQFLVDQQKQLKSHHLLFKYTIKNVIYALISNPIQQIEQQFSSNYEYNCAKAALQFIFLKQLKEYSNQNQIKYKINILKQMYGQKSYIKLKKLPNSYSSIGKVVYCKNCNKISPKLAICLLCEEWVGCMNCSIQSPYQHWIKVHRYAGLFLQVQKAQLFSFSNQLRIDFGILYKDQLGNNFKIQQNWDKYQMDQKLLKSIYEKLIHDEIVEYQ